MMPENEAQPGPENDVEQREKKESADKQGGEKTAEQLRKDIASERFRNQKLEKTIQQEGGGEGNERAPAGPERLEQLIIEEMSPSMEQGLEMNVNTNFSARDTNRLRSDYSRIQGSKAYVSSHTPESLASAVQGQLKRAFERYQSENPNDATQGGMQGADTSRATEVLKSAMLKSLQIVEKKVTDELQKRGVDPQAEQEKRITDGDQVRTLRAAPTGSDFSNRSRNNMRDFRNIIYRAETPDGIRYDRLTTEPPKNDGERAAARKFNQLARKFDEALTHCEENDVPATDKNARTALLKEYGDQLVGQKIETPDALPGFRDWIAQHPDKLKQAQEQTRKTAE